MGAAQNIYSTWGASASHFVFGATGTLYASGTGTTNFPQYLAQTGSATAVTTWNTAGTYFGVNSNSGFTGYFEDFHVNGGSSVYSVDYLGNLIAANSIMAGNTVTAGATFAVNLKSKLISYNDGYWTMTNNGILGFSGLYLGPTVAAPSATMIQPGSVITGTSNTNGANFTIAGSQGTGTGTGGSLIFQTALAGTTGTTQNALVTALTIAQDQSASFTGKVVVSATAITPNYLFTVNKNTANPPAVSTDTIAQFCGVDASNTRVIIDSFAGVSSLSFVRTDGTNASPTAVQANEKIGSLSAIAYNGSAYTAGVENITFYASENFTTGANGTYLTFATTTNGTTSSTERVRFDNAGNVLIGTTTASGLLTVNGTANVAGILTTQSGRVQAVRVVTAAGAVTVATTDDIIVVNKTVGAATTVNLVSSPATGAMVTVKDGKGDAGTNNITITPASGNIDGAGTFVMATNYESLTFVYNGTQWNIL